MGFEVGTWVARPETKWHYVDSVVADRVVTRCGREMKRVSARDGTLEMQEEKGILTEACDHVRLGAGARGGG